MAAAGDDPRPHAASCSRARSAPGVTTARARRGGRAASSARRAPSRRSRATAASPARSAPRRTRWSSTASRARTSSRAATSSRSTSASSLDGWVADARAHVPGRPGHARSPQKLLDVTEGVAVRRRRAVPARATASATSRTPSRRASRREGFSVVRSLVGHGIGRDDARGPADPELRRRRAAARCSRRAWSWRSSRWSRPAATRSGWATTAGRSSPRTARWPPTSSSRSRSRPTGPRILTPWHEQRGPRGRGLAARRPPCALCYLASSRSRAARSVLRVHVRDVVAAAVTAARAASPDTSRKGS